MSVQLTARNATPDALVTILNEQRAHKLDVVVPATNMKSQGGLIVVKDSEAVIDETGVTTVNGIYRPTETFDEGLSEKLGINRAYLRKMRDQRPDLLDTNVNGWLHGRSRNVADRNAEGRVIGNKTEVLYPADDRSFLLRLFRGDDGGEGVARAMLSDKYALSMDNLDMLTAIMMGINESGHKPLVRVSDLSERRMRVSFEFPTITAMAPNLLNGYKSPFDGERGVFRAGAFDQLRQQYGAHHIFSEKDAPLVYMRVDFSNSETGDGRYKLVPVMGVARCTNGWVETREGLAKTHLGARLEHGVIKVSPETVRKAGELVVSETKDALNTWLSTGYLEGLVAKRSEQAGVPVVGPVDTVPAIVQGLGFTEEERAGVLNMFVLSGQMTAGGVANAVTAYAQTVEDPDRAYEIESKAIDALEAAARR
jgi:hypothetical protein